MIEIHQGFIVLFIFIGVYALVLTGMNLMNWLEKRMEEAAKDWQRGQDISTLSMRTLCHHERLDTIHKRLLVLENKTEVTGGKDE